MSAADSISRLTLERDEGGRRRVCFWFYRGISANGLAGKVPFYKHLLKSKRIFIRYRVNETEMLEAHEVTQGAELRNGSLKLSLNYIDQNRTRPVKFLSIRTFPRSETANKRASKMFSADLTVNVCTKTG